MNVPASQIADPAIQAPEPFSVSATVSLQERRYRTLKNGDTFGVFDHGGDILSGLGGADGLYHQDTRHPSRFNLTLGGMRPLLLSSTLGADNVMLTSDLSNASTTDFGAAALDQGVIHVQRSLFLGNGACHGRLAVRSFCGINSRVRLELRFEADFADLFEVRGMHRDRRGRPSTAPPVDLLRARSCPAAVNEIAPTATGRDGCSLCREIALAASPCRCPCLLVQSNPDGTPARTTIGRHCSPCAGPANQ
jgi:N-terminal domain of (some) glycogen debranching enzymes